MPKVSIILPVYNVEMYLERCLESLLKQDLDDYEILVINDGSPDNSQEIIDNYAKKYPEKVKSYIKTNGGLSDARNYGLERANGEYIIFVDSDDYVKENMLKKLYEIGKSNNLDILCCDYTIVKDNRHIYNKVSGDKKSGLITSVGYFFAGVCAWNKMFKRNFLLGNRFMFPKGIIYEDLASIPSLVKYNPKIYYLNDSFVFYVHDSVSITRTKEYKKSFEDIFKACDIITNSLIETKFFDELEYLMCYHLLYLGALNFYKYEKYEQIDKISDFMKRNFPKWKKNKYLKNKSFKEKLLMKLFYYRKYNIIKLCQSIKR